MTNKDCREIEHFTTVRWEDRRGTILASCLLNLPTVTWPLLFANYFAFGQATFAAIILAVASVLVVHTTLRNVFRLAQVNWLMNELEISEVRIRQKHPNSQTLETRWDDLVRLRNAAFLGKRRILLVIRRGFTGPEPTVLEFCDGEQIKIPKIGLHQGLARYVFLHHEEIANAGSPGNLLAEALANETQLGKELIQHRMATFKKRAYVVTQLLPIGLVGVAVFLHFGLGTISSVEFIIYITVSIIISITLIPLVSILSRHIPDVDKWR